MSSNIAIRVRGLSKQYRIGQRDRYKSLRDDLMAAFGSPFRGIRTSQRQSADNTVWALKDISFEVKRGEAVGIIGWNGAGKSTLLKILSRITVPTVGRAELRGRVGSLLDVGTGFHPELTGRENIYLNGTILGMRKAEIARKFAEIVGFAEVERFIDTPVKHYSSGMYVRLAFSVAAHLDFEIMMIDEVLAVGDAAFQQKCLGKIESLRDWQGRTVLFVSHNMGSIKLLTTTCLLLREGTMARYGETEDVVNYYLQSVRHPVGGGEVDLSLPEVRREVQKPMERQITYQALRLLNQKGIPADYFFEGEPITIELTGHSEIKSKTVEFILLVRTMEGFHVFTSFSGQRKEGIEEGRFCIRCTLDPVLRLGRYTLRLYLRSVHWQDIIPEAATFRIESSPREGDELSYAASHPGLLGTVRVGSHWGDIVRVEDGRP